MTFNPYAPEDLSSETVFDNAISALGGTRTANLLGRKMKHKNADWVFPGERFIVEHKQLETHFTQSESFVRSEIDLRLRYVRAKKANVFGVPHDSKEFSRDYMQLFRKPLARIIRDANLQIRETRTKLGWPKGQAVLILSNKSLLELIPLAICMLIQSILEGANSDVGGAVYVTNHYVDIPGSNLANRLWAPVYKHGGTGAPEHVIRFIDDLGCGIRRTLATAPDFVPSEHRSVGPDAHRIMQAKPILPRGG